MKKIVILIALFAVIFAFLLTPTEILYAQIHFSPEFRGMQQKQQEEAQQRALIVGVCVGVGIFCLIMGFYAYMKERDKKEREWREKQDEKNREFLAKKLQENRDSDPPDK